MTPKQKRHEEEIVDPGTPGAAAEPLETTGHPDPMDPADAGSGSHGAMVEPADQAVIRLEEELDILKDRHLRVAAEYENFRKRTARERAELWSRAQADVVSGLLDALDDLDRVSELDPQIAKAEDVIKGVELVERKFFKELETAGLERIGELGEPFDPNQHEAIGSLPAASAKEDHTVGSVLQPGYKFGGALIRPARVQVRMWSGDDSGA